MDKQTNISIADDNQLLSELRDSAKTYELFGDFKTPKYREPTELELKQYNINKNNLSLSTTDQVWAAAITNNTPTYNIYFCGTNDHRILKYTPEHNTWRLITLDEVDNLYGLMHYMIAIIS